MLSKRERETILTLVSIGDWLRSSAEHADKVTARWLRTAATYTMKVCDMHCINLDQRELQQVLKAADRQTIVVAYKEKFKYQAKTCAEQLDIDAIYDLADFALQMCGDCKEDPKVCRLREVLNLLKIPPYTDDVGCEYAV